MRRRLIAWLKKSLKWLEPRPPDPIIRLQAENEVLSRVLMERQGQELDERREAREYLNEMLEAQVMAGSAPWHANPHPLQLAYKSTALREVLKISESAALDPLTQGVDGMYELWTQTVEWQREVNMQGLAYSRWGIQQQILICRLYYLKNPVVRRLVDVCAAYVFARGMDVTTEDDDANDIIKDFLKRNQRVFGHCALEESERTKDRDGNLFWCFFTDSVNTGEVNVRTIDAVEIQDIWTDPEDCSVEQYYKRSWTKLVYDASTGATTTQPQTAWYPALYFDPPVKPSVIGEYPVNWETPVYHRHVGGVGKWPFGVPRIAPMIPWSKEVKDFLTTCAGVRHSLASITRHAKTKGGQPAISGMKQQLGTTAGPGARGWDSNPISLDGSVFISGPGTEIETLKVQGATFDPEDVRQYKLMCCMVKGVPETFLGDVSTGNLATATTLDRPTETVMLSLQEEWSEDVSTMIGYALEANDKAPGGKLRESRQKKGMLAGKTKFVEAEKTIDRFGRKVYKVREADDPVPDDTIEIRVDFPSIREGDAAAMVSAIAQGLTLGNKGGQIVGMDEREGVRLIMQVLGVENYDEIIEEMYPTEGADAYDPDRTKEDLAAPIGKLQPAPGGAPQLPGGKQQAAKPAPAVEAIKRAATGLLRAIKMVEAQGDAKNDDES